jgi:hypothetical protein
LLTIHFLHFVFWGLAAVDEGNAKRPGMHDHLVGSLRNWSAFRGVKRSFEDIRKKLVTHLPKFIRDIQDLPGSRLFLSDVSSDEIESFANAVEALMRKFGHDVKGHESCVLPSKTAHMLLPTLVPAYDNLVVGDAMRKILPRSSGMIRYLKTAWWVLRRFREEGTLQDARDLLADSMLKHWLVRTLRPQNPPAENPLAWSLDSVLAEYTIIQMGQPAGNRHLLGWIPD